MLAHFTFLDLQNLLLNYEFMCLHQLVIVDSVLAISQHDWDDFFRHPFLMGHILHERACLIGVVVRIENPFSKPKNEETLENNGMYSAILLVACSWSLWGPVDVDQ
ncbi:hypothetical protein ACJX0J_024051 [Zea mays]